MLDKKVLELNYAVSYGSVTLKSLQNDNIPEIDLLVREAIQNSSDASLSVPNEKSFTVKFATGTFQPKIFNSIVKDLESVLDSKYPMESAQFLEIRDSKTSGLTGAIRKNEIISGSDHGNFFKLIYDTGKKQTQKNAGGNWGFGKSVYYRVGIGIVIFYSRIKTDNAFESRLIITLVEDENRPDALLNSITDKSAGKAWWGEKSDDDLLPVTDESLIEEILGIFGLSKFKPDETGTSIIIPYVNTAKLLENIIPSEADISSDVRERCTWTEDFDEYLKLSIQKWYAPKIHNLHLKDFCQQKWLRVFVNGVAIVFDDMLPLFKMVQELYTVALAKTYGYEYSSSWLDDISCLPVSIRNHFEGTENSVAGYVSILKVSKEKLYGHENHIEPYIYTRHFEEDPDVHLPMVMYARDPGMVIEYAISNDWTKNLAPVDNSDEYVFAFFVPISSKKIKESFALRDYAGMELGEYLRLCEASDHMSWIDPAKMQIVSKLQKNTVKLIRNKTVDVPQVQVEATTSRLSGKLGRLLLPRIGYGRNRNPGGSGGGSGGSGGAKINNVVFSIQSIKYEKTGLLIDYEIKMSQSKKNVDVSILINAEGGVTIDFNSWKKEIGTKFPIWIEEVSIDYIFSNVVEETKINDIRCNTLQRKSMCDLVELSILSDESSIDLIGFSIKSNILNPTIKGQLKLIALSKIYKPWFKIV